MESYYLFATIFVASLGILMVHLYRWKKGAYDLRPLPPGPPLLVPILGHLPNIFLARKPVYQYFTDLAQKYGPIISLRLGSAPFIVVSNPQLAKEVLNTHDKIFANRPILMSSRFINGIEGDRSITLLPYGEEWRQGRKLYSAHLLSAHRIHEFLSDTISSEIHHLISDKLQIVGITFVNLTDCFDSLLENIICRIILRQTPSQVIGSSSAGSPTLSRLMHEVVELLIIPLMSDYVPRLGFVDWKAKAAMKKWRSTYSALMDQVLARREQANNMSGDVNGAPRDILDVLLLPEHSFSKAMIKTYILELLGAAIQTTSTTLDWAMSELLSNRHVLAKLRAELDEVVGLERSINNSDIPYLPYLQAVVKETFRKNPLGPLLVPRISSESSNVGGYTIPKGTRLFVNTWAIGHDPEVWKDPEVFMPERFLVVPGGDEDPVDFKRHNFTLLPFGAGRRMCPGMDLGVAIVQLTLARLVHSLEWELPPGQDCVDMSEILGIMRHRVHPLLVLPPRSRLPHSTYMRRH